MEPLAQGAMVFIGGGLGALLRWGVGVWTSHQAPSGFPWATVSVNLVGSLAIGVLAGLAHRSPLPEPIRLFAMVGILGGFTTFSAFSLENAQLIRDGQPGLALANMGLQVGIGLGLAVLGFWLGMARGTQ